MIKELDRIYAIRVMTILLKSFEDQKAYELGLIDDKGNLIKNPMTQDEMESCTLLHRLCFQLKQIINDLPSGNFRLKKIAIAMALLRNKLIPTMFQESAEFPNIKNEYLRLVNTVIENKICFPEEEALIESYDSAEDKSVYEEMITTASIDSSTPRIHPKKKKETDDVESN